MSSSQKKGFFEFIKNLYDTIKGKVVSEIKHVTLEDGMYIRIGNWKKLSFGYKKGIMLVLPGRREFIEEYQLVINEFVNRGFDVWSMDWRGQGASSRMLDDPHKGHIDNYQTYINDLNYLITNYILDNSHGPLYVFAHSMGGHVTLRYLLENNDHRIEAAILSAPMLDIRTDPYPLRVARAITRTMIVTGNSERYIFGEGLYDPNAEQFEGNPFTSDQNQFDTRMKTQLEYPHCTVDGFTFGWLDATFKSINQFKKSILENNISSPILILSPDKDALVRQDIYPEICNKLKKSTLKIYPGARHCLMDEGSEIRSKIWQDVDEFLRIKQ